MSKIKDISGQKFGQLTVIKYAYTDKHHTAIWQCKCDCGNIVEVRSDSLRNGHTRSCGCLHKLHGKSNSRLYYIWKNMKQRCYNKNDHAYNRYGERGIRICDEWLTDFKNFYNWAMDNGYKENLTIDRSDVNGNYEPNNCRWATKKQQTRNKRTTKYITYNNETKSLGEWCDILGLNYDKIWCRLYRNNWPMGQALELEVK